MHLLSGLHHLQRARHVRPHDGRVPLYGWVWWFDVRCVRNELLPPGRQPTVVHILRPQRVVQRSRYLQQRRRLSVYGRLLGHHLQHVCH